LWKFRFADTAHRVSVIRMRAADIGQKLPLEAML